MDKIAEFDFLTAYAAENGLDAEICRDQLRVLWTAFCLHHDLNVDTYAYDRYLFELWQEIQDIRVGGHRRVRELHVRLSGMSV